MEIACEADGTSTLLGCSQIFFLEEILSCILHKLPLLHLARARSVCKQWNQIIVTKLHPRSSVMRTPLYLLCCPLRKDLGIDNSNWHLSVGHEGRAFDPESSDASQTWIKLPLPQSSFNSYMRLVPASSNSGLVALQYPVPMGVSWFHLWVGNPVTNRWKHIYGVPCTVSCTRPNSLGRSADLLLVVDDKTNSYKIIHFGILNNSKALMTNVYESTTNKWKEGSHLPTKDGVHLQATLIQNGVIYFLQKQMVGFNMANLSTDNGGGWIFSLVQYNVQEDMFQIVASGLLRVQVHDHLLDLVPYLWTSDANIEDQGQCKHIKVHEKDLKQDFDNHDAASIVAGYFIYDDNTQKKSIQFGIMSFDKRIQSWKWNDKSYPFNEKEWFSYQRTKNLDKEKITIECICGLSATRDPVHRSKYMQTYEEIGNYRLPTPYDDDCLTFNAYWSKASICSFIPRFDVVP